MRKAILIVVSNGFGGYGDFLFALKLSSQIKRQAEIDFADMPENNPSIYIITQYSGKVKIEELGGDTEFGVTVMTPFQLARYLEDRKFIVQAVIEPTFRSKIKNKTPNIIYPSSQVEFSAYPSYW